MRTTSSGLVCVAVLSSLALGAIALRAQSQSAAAAPGWSVEFTASTTNSAAKAHFVRGLTLMHLFMYPDAAREFQAAQQSDPAFAMAYWGEAMTYYRPIWREYEPEPARAIISRFGETPAARAAKAPTPREKAYIAALDVLYPAGDAGARLRNYAEANTSGQLKRYAEAVGAIATAYPDDDEALAFWAVSRVVQFERTDAEMPERMRTAALALEVLRRRPNHPGAPRYLIQSVDDPVHADLGATAARLYVEKNPDGPEARHLPTHISAQLGQWKEMADLNWQSFELSMEWTKAHGYQLKDLNNHDYGHLLTYAQYGYLQLGRYERARAMIDRARQDYEGSGHAPEIAATLAGTLAQYAVETRDPQALAELRRLVDEARVPGANLHYAIGLLSATAGDLARTRQEIASLDGRAATARIMRAELEAAVAAAEGDKTKAIALLATASAQDLAQIYTHFGPPSPYKPPHELHGEMLLAAGRPADALKAFQDGMRIYRRRTGLLLGATRAAAAANETQAAQRYAVELREIWRDADRGLPALDEIRRSTQQ